MDRSVEVEIIISGYQPVKGYKLFNLEDFFNPDQKLALTDKLGKKTAIYTEI